MKRNNKLARTLTGTVVVLGAAAMLSVGAFAAEDSNIISREQTELGTVTVYDTTAVDVTADQTIAGYLPAQEQATQGDIALYSEGERDPNFGGYGAPEGNPIQGDIMLISAGDLTTTLPSDTLVEKTEARYTVKGLLGKQVLYTARQNGRVLTIALPEDTATFRTTVQDLQTMLNQGVSTVVLQTNKTSTTLNLTLLVEGQRSTDRVVLRHLGDTALLTAGLRCRRDVLVGR